jgi:hypothetical protein
LATLSVRSALNSETLLAALGWFDEPHAAEHKRRQMTTGLRVTKPQGCIRHAISARRGHGAVRYCRHVRARRFSEPRRTSGMCRSVERDQIELASKVSALSHVRPDPVHLSRAILS